ncbi:MAG: dihydroorotase family protein [Candidatus Bathyarchaeia archaeon]|nr:dihydroorotase family protein [Candidatus Bathyarchaeota archaeon]
MVETINILNTKILLKEGFFEGGIHISFGKIKKIGRETNLPKAEKNINAKGLIALPGLIDSHVHLRDLNLSYKEDFYTGTCAAAAGGFTTVLDMPNTSPPTDSIERLKEKIELAKNKIIVNVGFHVLPPKNPKEINEIVKLGATSFKFYFNLLKDEDLRSNILKETLNKCSVLNIPLTIHGENGEKISRLKSFLLKKGKKDLQSFLKAHSKDVEFSGVKKALNLVKKRFKNDKVYFCHVSTLKSLNEIKRNGFLAEVSPHHLFLTKEKLLKLKGVALTLPPLRSKFETEALWKKTVKGFIDVIASDHAPHTLEEKIKENYWEVSPGIPGLETTLPLLLTKVNQGEISLQKLVKLLAYNPAKIFNLRFKGELREGFDADITLVNLKKRFKIKSEKFFSKAKYSPFNGFKCVGKPAKTIVFGKLVMDNGEIVAEKGNGFIIRRELNEVSS